MADFALLPDLFHCRQSLPHITLGILQLIMMNARLDLFKLAKREIREMRHITRLRLKSQFRGIYAPTSLAHSYIGATDMMIWDDVCTAY